MKQHIKVIRCHVHLYRDANTGLAWVEDGTTGCGHSCHPNIDVSGSVKGMKKLHWGRDAVVVRSHGFYHCTSRFSASDGLDYVAALHCQCGGKHVLDFEAFVQLIGDGYYDGPHGPEAFTNDLATHYNARGSRAVILAELMQEHCDLVESEGDKQKDRRHGYIFGQRAWLEEVIGDFVKKI